MDPYYAPRQPPSQRDQHHGYYTGVPFPPAGPSRSSHTPAYPPWVNQPTPYLPQPPFPPPTYPHAGPSRSAGRDYLLSIQSGMSSLAIQPSPPRQRTTSSPRQDKPLPRLPPPPPLPDRPYSTNATEGYTTHLASTLTHSRSRPSMQGAVNGDHPMDQNRHSTPPQYGSSSHHSASLPSPVTLKVTPPKSFRPSYVISPSAHLRPPLSEPRLTRPQSDPVVHTTPRRKPGKKKAPSSANIIVIGSDSDTSSSEHTPVYVTSRSPARRKRATSENPIGKVASAGSKYSSPSKAAPSASTPNRSSVAIRCAGFTRKGAPCQRLVKAEAPYLSMIDPNTEPEERVQARYCKDHAGMICNAQGFYWKSGKEAAGIWVDFADYIPEHLGQQTQALLRMTMESPLTDKEAHGFLYAYELRDLQNASTSFFKVGRTDNVPRRIGEWTTRCKSHTPTLRDIFPLSAPLDSPNKGLSRTPTLPTSYLPGAFRQTTNPTRTCPAVKRWERLVHLELADLATQHAPRDYINLKEKCPECQAVHREIFPLGRGNGVYEERVMEVVCRWERFVRKISSNR